MFFKNYFQISIIYYFFKFLIERIINVLKVHRKDSRKDPPKDLPKSSTYDLEKQDNAVIFETLIKDHGGCIIYLLHDKYKDIDPKLQNMLILINSFITGQDIKINSTI